MRNHQLIHLLEQFDPGAVVAINGVVAELQLDQFTKTRTASEGDQQVDHKPAGPPVLNISTPSREASEVESVLDLRMRAESQLHMLQ